MRINGVPEVAATLEVPASAPGGGDDGDGGEWELLLQKLRHWLASGQLQQQWQSARGPLSLLAGLIALLLVLRVYGALLGVLDSLPLVPGLLELVGVIAVTRFGLRRLVRSEERQAVLRDLQKRWRAFRGKA
ncbi:MAG: CAAD domain-containing protein [Vulcanococcus sp.]